MTAVLDVTAAVLIRDGRLLLATRRPGSHLAGQWEFPGGKVEAGETLTDCIRRELREELALRIGDAVPFFTYEARYEGQSSRIRLHFMWCEDIAESEPRPREGQQVGWFCSCGLPEQLAGADRAVLDSFKAGLWATPSRPGDGVPQVLDERPLPVFLDWLRSGL